MLSYTTRLAASLKISHLLKLAEIRSDLVCCAFNVLVLLGSEQQASVVEPAASQPRQAHDRALQDSRPLYQDQP